LAHVSTADYGAKGNIGG